MNYTIDSLNENDKEIVIQGWAFDSCGKKVDFKINHKYNLNRIYRYDVAAVFPDMQIEEQCGFELAIKKTFLSKFKKISIELVGKDKSVVLPLENQTIKEEREEEIQLTIQPKISIVIPVYNTPRKYFDELIDSIKKQSYSNWELCLADGGSNAEFKEFLKKYSSEKIKIIFLPENLGIAGNTNEAIKIATGDYIAFCDHDDTLTKDALLEVVKAINKEDAVFIYSDEDKMSMDSSKYFQPNRKSDFNMRLLEVGNYMNHLSVIKKDFIFQIGLLDDTYEGSQDYDLVLRVAENSSKIYHIKKILYHWRCHEDSVALNPDSKKYAFENAIKALQDHFVRIGEDVEVIKSEMVGSYKVIRK